MRNLSRGDDLTATGSDRARSAFVANLGSSWAARRAVTAMIRSHSIADVDEALSLIARLPTPSQRGWCLADLLEHWQVDNRDLDKILAAAPGEAVRRRLHRRAERATA